MKNLQWKKTVEPDHVQKKRFVIIMSEEAFEAHNNDIAIFLDSADSTIYMHAWNEQRGVDFWLWADPREAI